jgi:hypothetical protein
VALGHPPWGTKKIDHRIVKLTKKEKTLLGSEEWYFEPVEFTDQENASTNV